MLARLFVIFGGLFVLALTAALVAPYFIDWSSYRAEFEREASAILGRSVTVKGDATARLLPFPSVTFSDVAVGGGPSGEPAMTVEEFSMDAELAPFMRGEFLIFDMRLVRPKMNVSVDADGKVDWAMRPSSPFDPAQIAIEKLTITEGQVRISHATSGRDHLVSEINAEVSAKSLDGPWRVDGSLRLDGMLHGDRAVDRQGRREGRDAAAHQGRPGDLSRRDRKRRRRHASSAAPQDMPGPCISRRATIRRPALPASKRQAGAGQGQAAGMACARQLRARSCAARAR